jgi:hypothetical protein
MDRMYEVMVDAQRQPLLAEAACARALRVAHGGSRWDRLALWLAGRLIGLGEALGSRHRPLSGAAGSLRQAGRAGAL